LRLSDSLSAELLDQTAEADDVDLAGVEALPVSALHIVHHDEVPALRPTSVSRNLDEAPSVDEPVATMRMPG
jgi:hypothetical protein